MIFLSQDTGALTVGSGKTLAVPWGNQIGVAIVLRGILLTLFLHKRLHYTGGRFLM